MENEEDYQRVLSFLSQLQSLRDRLDEREVLKAYSEAAKQIVLQFEKCALELELRKDHLLKVMDSKLQEQKIFIQLQQCEIDTKIEGCKRILEGSNFLYESNREIALSTWKEATSLAYPKIEEGLIEVEFSPTLVPAITSYGKVNVDIRHITSNKAGYVTTLTNLDREAQVFSPSAIQFNPLDESLFVCDSSSNTIKRLLLKAETILASKDVCKLRSLGGIAFHHRNNIGYVVDKYSHTIKKLATSWMGIRTESFAGKGQTGYQDGTGTGALFNSPSDITVNQLSGDIYVSDLGNHNIRKITPQGVVTTIAGSGKAVISDGIGKLAQFKEPTGITFCDKTQSLYVCDFNKIRLISLTTAEVTTIPGEFKSPFGLVAIPDGTLLLSLFAEHKIMKIVPQGGGSYESSILVGSKEGNANGTPETCKLNGPAGITYDERTNTCYVADFGNRCIRKFSLV
eukprot:Phypoly_transcript_01371.p1 GENE.Phypoly_transcript_01371~~Phypoly_transcript_01371.p1  ORF type:complete len:456 (+),score=62.54 Phypoly_transcript_01371:2043-3410(+)